MKPSSLLTFLLILLAGIALLRGGGPVGAATAATASSTAATLDVPDTGWHLWLDRKADWRAEPAFFPDQVHLTTMTPHPPTGGWAMLSAQTSTPVTLPATVEQYFWGVNGLRPYQNEYLYANQDPTPRDGNYEGVSWWWRTLAVPRDFAGKTTILHLRAAKQVAEVYVNRRLVGYDLIAETSYDCDITRALIPGAVNTIAIRITNPGGRLDWGDWSSASVGKMGIYGGHAFGGLDRGLTLTAHGPVRFTDRWVLNTPDPRTVEAHAALSNSGRASRHGTVIATVVDPRTGRALAQARMPVALAANGSTTVALRLTAPTAQLWDLAHPHLYTMRFQFQGPTPDACTRTFGFRWFGPTGVGHDALLRLNGRRIRLYSAISWGFWGLNGLWPTPMLARKEVTVAKSLGLNALNFHRNVARAQCLDAADQMGLLRYTEPGGGMTLFWDKKDDNNSFQRYMTDKIEHMVHDFRSHPSLIMYVVQNELDDTTYQLPLAAKTVRMIHALDPSRIVLLKSGINAPGEMWMKPYDNTLYVDNGTGYSGWWDAHSVGTPDAWTDADYVGPNDHVYRNTDRREIVDYGEMGGSGCADNHALMIRQIKALGGKSYDLLDHEEINAAYNRFLDQHGFRTSFPTTDLLFRKIGAKQYDYWSHVLQAARLSDTTDYLTVSGWETTAIEDHGGIVDNLRNPHGDPQVIHDALRPVMPDLQVRTTALVTGDSTVYDLYFLNESDHPKTGSITMTLTDPRGRTRTLGRYPVPTYATDVFSYPVAAGLVTPKLRLPGRYVLTASYGTIRQSRTIHCVALPAPHLASVAVAGSSPPLQDDLSALGQASAPYDPGHAAQVTICAPPSEGTRTTSNTPVTGTPDPALYQAQRFGKEGMAFRLTGLPDGPATVTLGFDEDYYDHAGARVFDVQVNGKTALLNVDIYKLAGGKDRVWTATVPTQITDGTVTVSAGAVTADTAVFSTIRVDPAGAGGHPTAVYFGDKPYTAKDGTVWTPYVSSPALPAGLLDQVRRGMGLLILADQDADITAYAQQLQQAGVFHFGGLVGKSFAPWMGSWYIVGHHPLYAGLPEDTVMKSDYQVPVGSADGLLASGPGVVWATAYSRDHSRMIGAGDVIVPLGRGRIVFHVIPRMNTPFQRCWLGNALRFLAPGGAP